MKTFFTFISLIIQFVVNHENFNVPKVGEFSSNELSYQPSTVGTIFIMWGINVPGGVSGIYVITNTINGRQYIGRSSDIRRRLWEHKSKHSRINYGLYKAIQKHGIKNFTVSILDVTLNPSLLPNMESFWIDKLKPRYNIAKGGVGNSRPVSEKTKAILRAKAKQQWENKSNEERINIINNNLTGPKSDYRMSESQKANLRRIQLGKKQSPESRSKISRAMKIAMIGNQNGNKPIVCFKNGVQIKEYPSAKIAATKTGIDPTSITCVLKHRRKTAGGFSWQYLNQLI